MISIPFERGRSVFGWSGPSALSILLRTLPPAATQPNATIVTPVGSANRVESRCDAVVWVQPICCRSFQLRNEPCESVWAAGPWLLNTVDREQLSRQSINLSKGETMFCEALA